MIIVYFAKEELQIKACSEMPKYLWFLATRK
jgi:hypothetical protein